VNIEYWRRWTRHFRCGVVSKALHCCRSCIREHREAKTADGEPAGPTAASVLSALDRRLQFPQNILLIWRHRATGRPEAAFADPEGDDFTQAPRSGLSGDGTPFKC